eukprot:gene3521-3976_t
MSAKVFCGGLPGDCRESDLQEVADKFGKTVSVRVISKSEDNTFGDPARLSLSLLEPAPLVSCLGSLLFHGVTHVRLWLCASMPRRLRPASTARVCLWNLRYAPWPDTSAAVIGPLPWPDAHSPLDDVAACEPLGSFAKSGPPPLPNPRWRY